MSPVPLCPVTGKPAIRLVQWVSASLLIDLWRIECRVDVKPSFRGVKRFGLWESPTGLYFFDPMVEGDQNFYAGMYQLFNRNDVPKWQRKFYALLMGGAASRGQLIREEFHIAAGRVRPGDRVLDVGCGTGAFRTLIPHARYVGLDKHFGDEADAEWLRSESLADHARENGGAYDMVTAFQVAEHVLDPIALMTDMVRATRPGGYVVVGVPHVPSTHSRIPNYLINAIPHHLTWWTEAALRAAADRVGLLGAIVEVARWGQFDSVIYWMGRCSPVKCRDRHYRHSWTWHASALMGFIGGSVVNAIMPVPRTDDEGASLVLVARKPE